MEWSYRGALFSSLYFCADAEIFSGKFKILVVCFAALLIIQAIYFIDGKPFSLPGINSETTQQTLTYDTLLKAV